MMLQRLSACPAMLFRAGQRVYFNTAMKVHGTFVEVSRFGV
jgi:hypothetical protein